MTLIRAGSNRREPYANEVQSLKCTPIWDDLGMMSLKSTPIWDDRGRGTPWIGASRVIAVIGEAKPYR
jgi:hypothetical protein